MGNEPAQRILVLNRLWQPVNIIGVRRGFSLLCQDLAQVIHTAEGHFEILGFGGWHDYSQSNPTDDPTKLIHTVRSAFLIPRVLLLRDYDRLPIREITFNRQNLFERDGHRCQYCNTTYAPKELNLDHVIPRDRGGKTSWENVVTSCIRCNSRKANRLPHEAGMHLVRRPEKPKWRPFVSSIREEQCDESWIQFLNLKS
jgi:5-methylcytosine-specific restriction endonuclease McrA